MTALRAWYAARSLRERRLILAMLALALVTAIWGLVVIPVRDGVSDARARQRDAVERLGQTLNAVAAIRATQRRGGPAETAPLAETVRARAEEAGFPLARLDEEGVARVRIAIGSARAPALFAWIAALERDGTLVEAAAITSNGDRSVAATLTLRARAR